MGRQKGEVIKPLTIDVSQFKKRFNALSGLSSYERAMKVATERKRAAWAAYKPLDRVQLYDSADDGVVLTIVTPLASRAPKRSTKGGALHAQTNVIHRPTEILAILHALALFTFDVDDPVVRQDPNKHVWWCIDCKSFKPLTDFAKDKHNVHGLAFACKTCQRKEERTVWKRAA